MARYAMVAADVGLSSVRHPSVRCLFRDNISTLCVLARLLRNACVDLDDMLHVDRCRDMDELINV